VLCVGIEESAIKANSFGYLIKASCIDRDFTHHDRDPV
jgi:hypothetical protein